MSLQIEIEDSTKTQNPYLFKAKNITTTGELVKGLHDAHLSSQEEGIFGDFLEGLAVFILIAKYMVVINYRVKA